MLISFSTNKFQRHLSGGTRVGGGVLLEILGGGVPHSSPNRDLISKKKFHFSHPFSDLASKILTRFQTWPLRDYVIIS